MMRKLTIWMGVLVAASMACTISGAAPPDPAIAFTITPNLTHTAVFANVDASLAQTAQAATLAALQPQVPATQSLNPVATLPGSGGATATVPFTLGYKDPPNNPTTTPRPGGGPLVHAGAVVVATYVSPAPQIDGDFSDWESAPYPVAHVVFGPDYYIGTQDVNGTFQVGWDATHMYIGVEVIDNTFVQNASGARLYLGDSLEIVFDADVSGDFTSRQLSADDYQLGLSPGSALTAGQEEAYLWFPLAKEGPAPLVDVAVVMTAQGYKMEAAIPWSLFGVTPAVDQHFGFALSISDNDAVGQNWQQSMVSNVRTRYLWDPTTWGDVVLAKP